MSIHALAHLFFVFLKLGGDCCCFIFDDNGNNWGQLGCLLSWLSLLSELSFYFLPTTGTTFYFVVLIVIVVWVIVFFLNPVMARKRQALMFITKNVHRKAALDSRTSQFSFQNPAKTLCLHHHIADFRPFLRKSAFIFIPLWSDADNSFKTIHIATLPSSSEMKPWTTSSGWLP